MKPNNLKRILKILEYDENVLSYERGYLEIADEDVSSVEGVLFVTNKRVFFNVDTIDKVIFREYKYENISKVEKNIENTKNILNFKIQNKIISIEFKNITSKTLEKIFIITSNKIKSYKPLFY